MKFASKVFPKLVYQLKLPFKRWAYEILDQLVIHFIPPGKSGGILLYRLDLLGDYLMCRPFFQILRKQLPFAETRIVFAGNQILEALAVELDGNQFDHFFWIDRNRFINSLFYRHSILCAIRRQGFSTVIYPSHTRQYWLESVLRVSGARRRITASSTGRYMNEWEQQLSSTWYSQILETGEKPLFEFYRNRAFFRQLVPQAEFVSSLEDACFQSGKSKAKLILMAPGASTAERQWPETAFIRLIRELHAHFPEYRFGLIGGAAEISLCKRIAVNSGLKDIQIFAGETSLPKSMQILSEASLLISNESGPVHMAATTETACVCISNGNHFGRWNPYPASLSPEIHTCYPESFYPLEENEPRLLENYHEHSALPASLVPFERVFQACIHLLSSGAFQDN